MKISDIEVRCCKWNDDIFGNNAFRSTSESNNLDFLVVTLNTDEGLSASSFGFAGKSSIGAGHLAIEAMRPFLTGKDPFMREQLWHQFQVEDRWWNHLPTYSYSPFDNCLWLLGALHAQQPLYKYLGGFRNEIPVYCSSMVLPDADAYIKEALESKAQGLKAYKIHPPGNSFEEDLEIHRAVRKAVGDDYTLMSDPVAPFTLEEAVRFGRELEKLNYLWFEEPLCDENHHALKELTRILDIPIVGTEVIGKRPYSIASYISDRIVDTVRTDVSWGGGITGVMKTAHLAEAFKVNCELHTTIFHALEIFNLHCCGAIKNNTYFELLAPLDGFTFGLKEPLPIKNGIATIPDKPGLGIEYDWDLIDKCTVQILR